MPLTADRAKPAVPFGGQYRLIDFAISNLINSGLRQIVVLTQYKSHSLDRHVSQTWRHVGAARLVRRLRARAAAARQALVLGLGRRDPAEPQPHQRREARHRRRDRRRPRLPHGLQPDDRRAHRVGRAARPSPASASRSSLAEPVRRHRRRRRGPDARSASSSRSRRTPTGLADSPHEVLASMGNYIFDADALIDAVESRRRAARLEPRHGRRHHPRLRRPRRSRRLRPEAQRRARVDRSRPLLLARRGDDRLVLRRPPGPHLDAADLQPLQHAVADPLADCQLAAGEVRARLGRAHRQRDRLDRLARLGPLGHAPRAQRRRVRGRSPAADRRSPTRCCSTTSASGRAPACIARSSTRTSSSPTARRSASTASKRHRARLHRHRHRHHRRRQGRARRRADVRAHGARHGRGASVGAMPATSARFLVVLDADSTLIRNEVIELLADEAGRGAEVAAATEAAMRGEVDFADEPALAGAGARRRARRRAFARVLARIEPTPGVRELIAAVHARGGRVGVVSGGFHEILDTVAPDLGVDVWRANRLGSQDGALDRRGRRRDRGCRGQGARRCASGPHDAGVPLSAHDRDRRRRERPADDGRCRARTRVQREADRARRRRTSWSGRSTCARSSRCCPDRPSPGDVGCRYRRGHGHHPHPRTLARCVVVGRRDARSRDAPATRSTR